MKNHLYYVIDGFVH